MKKDRIIKQQQELIAKEKDNFITIIKYLIDSYYFDYNNKLTIEKIKSALNIDNSKILEIFIKELKRKKLIKGSKEFTITFDGFIYLEDLRMKYNEYENNFINIIISVGALLIASFATLYSNNIILMIVMTILTLGMVFHFLNQILKKKYK